MTTTRKRGRPVGSGIDDSRFLVEVADLMHANPALKARGAMNQVISRHKATWRVHSEAAMLRRLQDKWQKQGVALLAQAQRRAEARERPVTLSDIVEIGIRVNAAVKALRTPVHIERITRVATAVAETLDRITRPVANIQKTMDRMAVPVVNAHRVMAAHRESIQRIENVRKSIELARLPRL